MASKSLGTLTLDLVAKIGGFTGPLDKAGRHSKKTSADIAKAGKAMGVAIGAGAVAAAAGIALIVNRQRELIDQQAKAAQQLDTTYTSMANLERAGELGGVGMEKISAAGRQLNLNIGKAIQGTDLQVAAFDRLGLSAQDLFDLPLDQRISKINQALRDNVQSSERAAVAADIFGAKNAKAVQQLDPATLAEAARQVEIFGLNLSDVDAAKVEMANDAMSTFGMLGDGIGKQLTVELAPALKAIGDLFLESAEEAGGMGNVVGDSVDKVINAMAFVMDAADGVKRAFEITADGIIFGIGKAVSFVTNNTAGLLSAISMLPGVDYSAAVASLRQFAVESNSIAREAANNIDANLSKPMAGERFKQFYADAKAAGATAAEATVAARKAAAETGEAFVAAEDKKTKAAKKTVDAVVGQISALERAAKTWGMSADEIAVYSLRADGATDSQLDYAKSLLATVAGYESAKKAGDDYASLVADLRTEEEKRSDTLREQLAILDAMQGLQSDERREVVGRAASAAFEDAPTFTGDSAASGPLGELSKLDDAQEELEDWYAAQMEALAGFRAERSDLNAEWDSQELALKQQHEDSMANIERARWQTGLAATSEFLTQLQGLRDTDSKKGKAVAKAAAIVQATINAYTAATGAYASASAIPVVGWVLGPIAAGAALAAGLANVAAIKGQAHDGIMSVPSSGTWNLEKGERVTTANTSAALDKTLANIQAGQRGGGGGAGGMSLIINMPPMKDQRENREATAHTARKIGQVMRSSGRYS